MLADEAWFWALTAAAVAATIAGEPTWRRTGATIRARALRGHLVEAGPGIAVDPEPGGPWSEPWLPGLLLGLWVCASPWIWGYDDVDGAIATDVITGAVIALVSVLGIAFPALLALNVVAGLWLAIAPWLVGYGRDGDATGLSDTLAGVLVAGLALRGMTTASRRVRAAQPGPVGRIPRRSR